MKYALVEDGIVKQIQPNSQDGFIEVNDSVSCGMVDNGDNTFSIPPKTQIDIQTEFRTERDLLINQADIEIYKLEDNAQDTTAYRVYRQALRDSTINWVLPTKP